MTPLQMLLMKGDNALNKADEFMQKPGGNFLMNLLAQSGYSTTPDSPLGAVGRAGIMTQQQQRQSSLDDMQRRLVEAQIGKLGRDAESGSQVRTHSATTLANGNIGIVTSDPKNPVIDTGVKQAGKAQIIEYPGIGIVRYDPVSNTLSEVAPEEVVRTAGAERRGAEQAASTAAQRSTEQQFNIPGQIRGIDAQIRSIDSTLEEVERAMGLVSNTSTGVVGNLLKGIPLTDAYALNKAIQPILASLSFDKLAEMKAASPSGGALGQVSERELRLLQDSLVSLDQAQSPGDVKRALNKVLTHYQNWKSVIEQHKGTLESQQQGSVSGFRIVGSDGDN